ncbi:nucleoside-specific channel-forming Tsx family protein [Aliarcobacter cibarius]|uniref:Nucleoside-specific channel-forming protein n=1 Tax=Aliarcobacter cibarius TaxID=255507 RepID=A0A7L5JRQ9_9BACT|nr:outer membrane protein OmpK [Aliarcobacter cibarius]QKJ27905.1 nucleoside-specific channel-forming protein [Aliarcobacter cibarius]TLT04840.1 ion channel protein Tsx [Aliarcobacter cibarius]
MKKFLFIVLLLNLLFFSFFNIELFAKDISTIENKQWANVILMKGVNQRGGPFKFDDTYLEVEFGGRYEWLDLYGYVDFIDILNSKSSDKHGSNNYFVDIEPRISLDYLFNKDFSYKALKELYLAFDYYYADEPNGKGLNVLWMGIGSDIDIPWLGTSGVNFYTRYIDENYGASNEHTFDGYVAHINWFKPLYFFTDSRFISFQGYLDYEFGSDLDENSFERQYRTSDSLQSYLGLYLHNKSWLIGYGLKAYKNMTQWKDNEILNGKKTDSTGFGHYFSIAYKF